MGVWIFSGTTHSRLNAPVILERNETLLTRNEMLLERNETRLERNDMRLARNETRSGNLHLSGTVTLKEIFLIIHNCPWKAIPLTNNTSALDRSQTHDLPNTRWALFPLSYRTRTHGDITKLKIHHLCENVIKLLWKTGSFLYGFDP